MHLDHEYASQTVFKKNIIHGFLGARFFSKILGTKYPGAGTVYLKQDLDFKRPMFVGVQYEAVFTVKEINLSKVQLQ